MVNSNCLEGLKPKSCIYTVISLVGIYFDSKCVPDTQWEAGQPCCKTPMGTMPPGVAQAWGGEGGFSFWFVSFHSLISLTV